MLNKDTVINHKVLWNYTSSDFSTWSWNRRHTPPAATVREPNR